MHAWIISHPITFTLILFVASIPFSLFATEIKQFLKLPPQRLSVWILKARLSSAEERLKCAERMRADLRYFIFTGVSYFTLLFLALLMFTLAIYGFVYPLGYRLLPAYTSLVHKSWFYELYFWTAQLAALAGLVIFLASGKFINVMRDVMSDNPEHKLNALNEKIERLRRRLEEKGEPVTPATT